MDRFVLNQNKEPVSNIFLRMFQLGCQLVLGYWATRFRGGTQGCNNSLPLILSILAYIFTAINLFALCFHKRRQNLSVVFFWVMFVLNIGLIAAFITISATRGTENCGANKALYQYFLIQPIVALALLVLMIFLTCCQCFSEQLIYSNLPGNLAFGPIFLLQKWGSFFQSTMLIVGSGVICLSILTFFYTIIMMYCLRYCSRQKTFSCCCRPKYQAIVYSIIAIACLIGLVVMAFFGYNKVDSVITYSDMQAKKLLQIFIAVSLLDILFWLYGCCFAFQQYQGDIVRNQAIFFQTVSHGQRNSLQVNRDQDGIEI